MPNTFFSTKKLQNTYNQNNDGDFPVREDNHHGIGYSNIAKSEPAITR